MEEGAKLLAGRVQPKHNRTVGGLPASGPGPHGGGWGKGGLDGSPVGVTGRLPALAPGPAAALSPSSEACREHPPPLGMWRVRRVGQRPQMVPLVSHTESPPPPSRQSRHTLSSACPLCLLWFSDPQLGQLSPDDSSDQGARSPCLESTCPGGTHSLGAGLSVFPSVPSRWASRCQSAQEMGRKRQGVSQGPVTTVRPEGRVQMRVGTRTWALRLEAPPSGAEPALGPASR